MVEVNVLLCSENLKMFWGVPANIQLPVAISNISIITTPSSAALPHHRDIISIDAN